MKNCNRGTALEWSVGQLMGETTENAVVLDGSDKSTPSVSSRFINSFDAKFQTTRSSAFFFVKKTTTKNYRL